MLQPCLLCLNVRRAYCCLRARACPHGSPLQLSVLVDIRWTCAIQIRCAWDASRGSCDVTIAVPLSEGTPGRNMDFVCSLLSRGQHDVLFPAHEQAFLFSRMRRQIPPTVALAVPEFRSFLRIQSKGALVRTLTELSIPQPESLIVRTEAELLEGHPLPFFLKTDYGTASTGTWRVNNKEALTQLVPELKSRGLFEAGSQLVIQGAVRGSVERVQAVFDAGR